MTQLPPLTEAQLQEKITARARARGWLIHHDRRQDLGIGGDAGFPDLVMARRGRIIIAELKSEKGKTTPAQEAWLEALGANTYPSTVLATVWRPRDWAEIERVLQ